MNLYLIDGNRPIDPADEHRLFVETQLISAASHKGAIAEAVMDGQLIGPEQLWVVQHIGTTEMRAGVVRSFKKRW